MEKSRWLLFVPNLPGRNQTLRMRVWRGLKASGAAALRDGVYVLPESDLARKVFQEQTDEICAGGGAADVFAFAAGSAQQDERLRALLDRSSGYADLLAGCTNFKRGLARMREAEARRRLGALHRQLGSLEAIDFFPGAPLKQAQTALADLEQALNARFSPEEPHAKRAVIRARDPRSHRSRLWATRRHLWVDRVCCAWLIRRFIDRRARFLWLKRASDCPKRALGFDFDGAEFSHVGSRVTFEVLLASFGLESDPALTRLGALVHHLDSGGVPVPEAAGFAAILTGARAHSRDDDELLRAMTPVLDDLYTAYSNYRE